MTPHLTSKAVLFNIQKAHGYTPAIEETPLADEQKVRVSAPCSTFDGEKGVVVCYRSFGCGVEDVLVSVGGEQLGFRHDEVEMVG